MQSVQLFNDVTLFFSLHTIHKRLTAAYNSVTRNFLYRFSINKNLTFCGPLSQIISPHALIIHNVMKHLTLKYLKQETLKYGIISGFSLTSSG